MPPTEEIDGVLLLRPTDGDFPSLTEAAEVAMAVGPEDATTILVGAPAGEKDAAAHWARLGLVLDSLRDRDADRVRLVLSGAGHDRPDKSCVARRIADAWELKVIAPDGAVLITPGGTLFVHQPPTPGGGWWCFEPGAAPRPLGRRSPAPRWQNALRRVPSRTSGGCVVDQIPAGVAIRPAEAPAPRTDDLSFAVPVDHERPLILIGAPGAEDVAAEEIATVLAALPAEHRSRARLAPGGRHDLLRLGQSVADKLGGEVEVLTGLPLLTDDAGVRGVVRANLIGSTGERSWQPYVAAVICGPTGDDGRPPMPRPTLVHPPLIGTPAGRPDFAPLTVAWGVAVTRAGLAVVPLDGPRPPVVTVPVDRDTLTIELGAPGQPLNDSLLPALARLMIELGARTRGRATLLVRGRLALNERALRELATEYGVAGIRYATRRAPLAPRPGGRAAPAASAPERTQSQARLPGTPTASDASASTPRRAGPPAGAPRVPTPEERSVAGLRRPAPVRARVPAPVPAPVSASPSASSETRHPVGGPRGTARKEKPPPVPAASTASTAPAVSATAPARPTPPPASGAPDRPPVPGTGAASPPPTGDAPAAPARFASVPYRPDHVSTPDERAGFRDLAAPGWERHGAAVARWLTRLPSLRGQEPEEFDAELIALHAYLTDEDGPLHHDALARELRAGGGQLPGYAACLASALRRLPSHRGAVVRGGGQNPGEATPEAGTLLLDPAPVGALALPRTRPGGAPVRYVIWSRTGRSVAQLLDRPEAAGAAHEVVFAPGSAFRVLGTRTLCDAPVVLLRELQVTTAVYQDGVQEELSDADHVALDRLERALTGSLSDGGGADWPSRCTGPVGHGV